MRIRPGALACFLALTVLRTAHGVDASKLANKVEKFESWQAIQFAMPTSLVFRIAETSANYPDATITIDLSEACEPRDVVLNWKVGRSMSEAPFLVLAYKLPGKPETQEFVAGVKAPHDEFEFFSFKGLGAKELYATNGQGNLAIWIPPSGDGSVKRSSNMYFPLDGFTAAYDHVSKLCKANQ